MLEPTGVAGDLDDAGNAIFEGRPVRAELQAELGHQVILRLLPSVSSECGPVLNTGGHRDTVFRSLREIRKNDLIQFETLGGN